MSRLSVFPAAALATGLVLVASACASPSTTGWETPSVPETAPPFSSHDSLPFDSYTLSASELERMQAEQARMLEQCAAAQGLEVSFGGDYIRPAEDDHLAWGGRLGTMDLDHAAEYGYLPSPDGPWANMGGFYIQDPTNVQPMAATDSDVLSIVYGVSEPGETSTTGGGCYGQVESAIGGPPVSTVNTSADLINLSLKHPRVVKAAAAWKTCMAALGYEFETVQAPSETPVALSQDEIETAIADVQCVQSSHWADTFYFVLADYQRQAIKRSPAVFEESLSSLKHRLELLDSLSSAPSS